MSSLDELRWMFFLECAELLEALDDGFDRLSAGNTEEPDPEEVNAVFRAVHSIKGGAASFGLEELVRFAHSFETLLDAMRAGKLVPSQEDWLVLRRAGDTLADLVAAARDEQEPDRTRQAEVAEALERLTPKPPSSQISEPLPSDAVAPLPISLDADDTGSAVFAPLALDLDADPLGTHSEDAGARSFDITFATKTSLFENGHDPVHLFRELAQMGALSVSADHADLPESPDPDQCYLTWRLRLETDCTEQDIREIFEFVEPLAALSIVAPAVAPAPEDTSLPKAPDRQTSATAPDGESAPESARAEAKAPAPNAEQQPKSPASTAQRAGKSTVRVDLDLVDELINIVGELVINQSFLSQSIADAGLTGQTHLAAGLDEFKRLARQIQEGVMAIRAQSVKPLFQRMARIVREAAAVADKPVRFETLGETTEVDTTVIERLVDPLTHILRNAVDHGLENAATRAAAGKREQGTVRLSADHRSGRVLIEISDDGGGINRAKVLEIAREKGLVSPEAVLQDADIDRLLFQPGFSTAETVTDLSGRGVGMDVVRSAIQKLGGRINIASTPGQGTTISISLPLTLAVLEGMVVKVQGQTMVVPITAIMETLRPAADEIEQLAHGAKVVRVRDTLVPIVDLGRVFGYRPAEEEDDDRVLLLVETEQGKRWALGVDEIRDQRQVVIKSLEENYGRVPGVAAATILGDGRIALIIDPEETIRTAAGLQDIETYLPPGAARQAAPMNAGA